MFMAFEAVGTVIGKTRAPEARIKFSDGSQARVNPKLKVFQVSAPSGQTCALTSDQGAPYLASMCNHPEVIRAFEERFGAPPWEIAGVPAPPKAGQTPEVESVHLVDRYV